MRFLAIDPGGTTGLALYDKGFFNSFEYRGTFSKQSHAISEILTEMNGWDAVICESFIITPNTGTLGSDEQKYYPLMLIGVIRHYWSDTVMQTPARRKWASPDKLKKLGWWNPSKGNHRNDAAAHLLTYLGTTVKDETILRRLV